MAEQFTRAVDDGLRLSKRLYFGKDRAVAPPRPMAAMEKAEQSHLPAGLMVYGLIVDPAIVDNPDIPSYQPHVHGRCNPPALIPLQMNGVALEADCYLDTAFVTVSGSWRVHCVLGNCCCDCRIAIPMGEQGSILGVDVEVSKKFYSTQIVPMDDRRVSLKAAKVDDEGPLKAHIFTLTIPQVDGGSNLSITARWSQKLMYHNGQFTLKVPFTFPEYVIPPGKKISKKEKIQLNINSFPGTEILLKTTSHPLKELRRQAGNLHFFYESEVLTWSRNDFVFTYDISSSHTFGGVLLQSPSLLDIDQRDMFCCYLFPGNHRSQKVFKKEVVFVVDISGSMGGKPIEETKKALLAALSKFDPQDSFNVVAFNGESLRFSSSFEFANKEAIENVTQWINKNFVAVGGTNILLPLNQALEMFSDTGKRIPIIVLITDGAVEDERHICNVMKSQIANHKVIPPRIFTFGIGSYCNHYFLRTLAWIGRGQYDAAYDIDSIEVRMQGLFSKVSSIILASIVFENIDDLDGPEVYPSQPPDLSSESPLIISGRYRGRFPGILKAKGVLADMSNLCIDLKVQEAKNIHLDKVLAKQQVELLTAEAWFTENKELEEKIAQISVENTIVSEYTRMVLLEIERQPNIQKVSSKTDPEKANNLEPQKLIALRHLGVGFGDYAATVENIPPGSDEIKQPEAAEILAKAASNCCGKLCDFCCCMCCIRMCSRLNDQCAIALSQFFGALTCLGCFTCCDVCCSGQDG